jgi:hypothetical protein
MLCEAWTDRGLAYSAKGGLFNNICSIRTLDESPNIFMRDKTHPLLREDVRKDYECNSSGEKKNLWS